MVEHDTDGRLADYPVSRLDRLAIERVGVRARFHDGISREDGEA